MCEGVSGECKFVRGGKCVSVLVVMWSVSDDCERVSVVNV